MHAGYEVDCTASFHAASPTAPGRGRGGARGCKLSARQTVSWMVEINSPSSRIVSPACRPAHYPRHHESSHRDNHTVREILRGDRPHPHSETIHDVAHDTHHTTTIHDGTHDPTTPRDASRDTHDTPPHREGIPEAIGLRTVARRQPHVGTDAIPLGHTHSWRSHHPREPSGSAHLAP